jgi:hypothetical protein
MFVLPQTTAGVLNDADDAETAVEDKDEFGLELHYTIGGLAKEPYYIQFGDLDAPISGAGVTFEPGKQYVLNLTFGAGSGTGGGPGGSDQPSVDIGATISFGELGVDGYGRDVNVPKMESDSWPEFARSNIYYDATGGVETLTFSEEENGKSLYQGLYFKYGSLIGVSAGANGTSFGGDTYLFIPDRLTGKYTKIQVSQIAGHGSTTDAVGLFKAALVGKGITWGTSSYTDIWNALPYVADGDVQASGSGRNENGLTVHSDATLYAQYKGDICKFMSYNPSSSGLSGKWRLPVSSEFGPSPGYELYYTRSTNWDGSFSGGVIEDGTGIMADNISFYTFSRVLTGTDELSFPVSGSRGTDYGYLNNVGDLGNYWSSSAHADAEWFAYYLFFHSGDVNPVGSGDGRTSGFSTRCVRE